MMISPETYYDTYLRGKTPTQILSKINGLKRQISHLKFEIERGDEDLICPDRRTMLYCNKLYLQRAIEAYEEAGGVYELTRKELTAKEFEDNIPFISKIIFSIGGFFGGNNTTTIDLSSDKVVRSCGNPQFDIPETITDSSEWYMTKDEFLEELKELQLGEWRRHYDTRRFGEIVLDGTQWELKVEYSNGHKPFGSYGDNAYPYNFDRFGELLGINAVEE